MQLVIRLSNKIHQTEVKQTLFDELSASCKPEIVIVPKTTLRKQYEVKLTTSKIINKAKNVFGWLFCSSSSLGLKYGTNSNPGSHHQSN